MDPEGYWDEILQVVLASCQGALLSVAISSFAMTLVAGAESIFVLSRHAEPAPRRPFHIALACCC